MFLVDGSHVLGYGRSRLVRALTDLARSFAAPSAVVFAGIPGACGPPHTPHGRVRVLYAGASYSVGGRILEILAHEGRKGPITVVTADAHLAACAREGGARVSPMHLLRRALNGAGGVDPAPGSSTTWSRPPRLAS